MADSKGDTREGKMMELNREAVLMCVVPDDISGAFKELLRITSESEKDSDRISAIRTLLEYSIAKPKQGLDVTSDGQSITGYTFEIVKANEKES